MYRGFAFECFGDLYAYEMQQLGSRGDEKKKLLGTCPTLVIVETRIVQ